MTTNILYLLIGWCMGTLGIVISFYLTKEE